MLEGRGEERGDERGDGRGDGRGDRGIRRDDVRGKDEMGSVNFNQVKLRLIIVN